MIRPATITSFIGIIALPFVVIFGADPIILMSVAAMVGSHFMAYEEVAASDSTQRSEYRPKNTKPKITQDDNVAQFLLRPAEPNWTGYEQAEERRLST